jgi:phosphinothricin acetyltransferase
LFSEIFDHSSEVMMNRLETRIRVATPEDAQALVEIYSFYCLSDGITAETETPTISNFADRIRQTLLGFPYFVIEEKYSHRILGYSLAQFWQPRQAWRWIATGSIYIHPEFCHHGLGKKLYDRLTQALKDQNFVELLINIMGGNEASAKFHEKYGFQRRLNFEQLICKGGQWRTVTYWGFELNERRNPPDEILMFPELDQSKYEDP